ncbi:MAG: deoxynucleoside kinase [Burkholderiaceae bacterium]|nr:deoxynucleoside kinase [Burkholderiaceae bacterium]
MRIEICGGIASGKTTLANLLQPMPVREHFKDNPFWHAFYADPASWFEEKNISFLIQHTAAIKGAAHQPLVVCDFAVVQDLAYAALSGDSQHLQVMRVLFDHMYRKLRPPELIVHLRCSAHVQRERIAIRARKEESGITLAYLSRLNEAIEAVLRDAAECTDVLEISSDRVDFASDRAVAVATAQQILARVKASLP